MVCELFKLNHCESMCINCTITVMNIHLFCDCDDSSCKRVPGHMIDLIWSWLWGSICAQRSQIQEGPTKKKEMQWISQYLISSICKMFFWKEFQNWTQPRRNLQHWKNCNPFFGKSKPSTVLKKLRLIIQCKNVLLNCKIIIVPLLKQL